MPPIDVLTPGTLSRAGVGGAFAFLASAILSPGYAASVTAPAEKIVYSFQGAAASDGAYPKAALINVAGTLYGTTWQGGADGYGTVFKVTTSGTETPLYSFQGPVANDGAYPLAGLIDVGNVLYGTTYGGGAYQYGTSSPAASRCYIPSASLATTGPFQRPACSTWQARFTAPPAMGAYTTAAPYSK